MYYIVKFKYIAIILITAVLVIALVTLKPHVDRKEMIREEAEFKKSQPIPEEQPKSEPVKKDYIKWVDFDVSKSAMDYAYKYDIRSYGDENHVTMVELLAYLGAKYGGDFSRFKYKDIYDLTSKINNETSFNEIVADMKYYSYYREAYGAVLDGFVGEFTIDGEKRYGLKVFSPIGGGYGYSHYDDFGVSRSYGYRRKHLGHDLMNGVGTPVIAIESGYVEAVGWNQYGGWRLGIRSFDKKRYYYYAHLRKDHPYAKDFKEGDFVTAGDVIGYMGMTGYSVKENVNNINTPHLHLGLQLIFDESQKDGINQIWIDLYDITNFLTINQSYVKREGNELVRKSSFTVLGE
ncbi:MAG: M23 family metallopeptidase [Clostridia bacterium]|nr:M23 family metallopeptidase [Clostridia bacterium]MBQ9997420.1 M23 family metallopeptidase [Clostridia bacterium]